MTVFDSNALVEFVILGLICGHAEGTGFIQFTAAVIRDEFCGGGPLAFVVKVGHPFDVATV